MHLVVKFLSFSLYQLCSGASPQAALAGSPPARHPLQMGQDEAFADGFFIHISCVFAHAWASVAFL